MNKTDVSARVERLLSQMTLEEKAAQMIQVPYTAVGRKEALEWAKKGAGSFLHVLGDDARELQAEALKSRLGIPVLFGIDAIHGHGLNKDAAIFPSQLAAACSWEPELLREMGEVTAREVATDGLHWTFSPVLCLGRDTRWGRVDETFGEDPYLAGLLGAAVIKGYQGDSLADDEHILACAKHYIAYGEAVGARDACDSEITERKLREVFLKPFAEAAKAGCATFMTAYGSMDGTPFTASRKVMHDILRDELGFDGFVVTDWDNVSHMVNLQHVFADHVESSAAAAKAGNDMIMTTTAFYEGAVKAVQEGRMEESVLDDAVRHILTVKFRMGLFEQPEKKGKKGCIGCEAHQQATLKAARKSLTLLKNNGVLPLKNDVKRIAVIGANADDLQAQYGDWTYFSHPGGGKYTQGVRPYVTMKEGFEALCAKKGVSFTYARGCGPIPCERDDISAAVEAAKDADVVFLAVGDRIEQIGETKDRANLDLSGRQDELFRALKTLRIPIVTVLIASKPLCIREEAEDSDAVICAFNNGQFGGQAIAEAAFGLFNPGGRLPISFPRHSGQVPVYYNSLPGWHGYRQAAHYCDLPAEPLYTFGEGMGYAPFSYADLTLDEETLTATVSVTNQGGMTGEETVQVYFRDEVSSVMTPIKNLIAMRKVVLTPGETKSVSFRLKKEDFALIDAQCQAVTEPGEFTLFVGHSAKDGDLLSLRFTLK